MRTPRLILIAMLTFYALSSVPAYAVRFTTIDDKAKQEEKTQADKGKNIQKPCTQEDWDLITQFNQFMLEKQNEAEELQKQALKISDQRELQSNDYKQLQKSIEYYQKIETSQEYQDMTVVYKRCEIEIPRIYKEPFFMPF